MSNVELKCNLLNISGSKELMLVETTFVVIVANGITCFSSKCQLTLAGSILAITLYNSKFKA